MEDIPHITLTDLDTRAVLVPVRGLLAEAISEGTANALVTVAGRQYKVTSTVAQIQTLIDAFWNKYTSALRGVYRLAVVNNTAVGNVGTGEDNLISYTLPANTLSADGNGVRITAWGTGANNGDAKTLKLYFGTAAILTTSLTTSQVDTWRVEATVWRTGSNAQDYESRLNQAGTTSIIDVENGTTTQTDTATITIKLTGEATSNNDIINEGLLVEVLD